MSEPTPLPPPNPAEGEQAAAAANHARDAVKQQLTDGTIDLAGVFALVDGETDKHVIGHMHVRAMLEALPKIGDVRSAEILDSLGIKHDEHIDVLGDVQRTELIAAVTSA